MAFAKIILNGETLMDVTSDTVEASKLLSEYTATKNDGTKVTGSYVPPAFSMQSKTVTPTESVQNVTADSGYDGLSKVTVNAIPSAYIIPSGTSNITTNGLYDIGSYKSVSVNVAGGEGGGKENEIIARTISTYENSAVSIVGEYAFMKCTNLSEVAFPNVTEIRGAAFSACSSLNAITFPNVQILGNYCFGECSYISTASFPNALSIGSYAFAQCSSLTSVYAPLAETVGGYTFSGCTKLSIINLNNAVSIGDYAFQSCKSLQVLSCSRLEVLGANAFSTTTSFRELRAPNLTSIGATALGYTRISSISFPKLTTIGIAAFINCTSLTSVSLPLLMSITQSAFRYCTSLSTASFNAVSYISSTAFASCYRLTSLYILSTSVVGLGNINVFSSTPIAGYTGSTGGVLGSIYVPASLYDSYVLATNWSNYSSRIVSV